MNKYKIFYYIIWPIIAGALSARIVNLYLVFAGFQLSLWLNMTCCAIVSVVINILFRFGDDVRDIFNFDWLKFK